ncbi:MAG: type II secretion system protein [Candidatus Omnitrophota bacterium]
MPILIKRKGFTLVEIMIVVAIVSLLAALAIPGLLRARLSASETAAIANTKIIRDACINYHSSRTPPDYPPDLVTLGAAVPQYIDSALAAAIVGGLAKQGYNYDYKRTSNFKFECTAISAIAGGRQFFVDEEGVIKINDAAGPAI